MSKYAIDGLFLTQRTTGIQRFAKELVNELDKLLPPDLVEIVVPSDTGGLPKYRNINIKNVGSGSGTKWQQLFFSRYVRKNRLLPICLMNTLPFFYPRGIVVIHDISYKVNPVFFKGLRGKLSAKWHCMCYKAAVRAANKGKLCIITVSKFSKSELERVYKVKPDRVTVVYDAWQHVMDIKEDEGALDKYGLKKNEFFFALSSLMPNKNFNWIVNAAKNNPDEYFVVAGGDFNKESGRELIKRESDGRDIRNISFVGYVSDEEAKALMKNCKGFLFPSIYEGFGIPPLEAVAAGTRCVFVSDIPVMREIYEDYVNYINPYDYEYRFDDELKLITDEKSQLLLSKYSFKNEAEKLAEMIKEK